VISRPFLSSIAFRLPFAIVFICVLVFSLSAIAVFGLQKARDEMATYRLQAFSNLAKASLVSRQVSDLVSSAPFLMNATSPYRVASESRVVVEQVDNLMETINDETGKTALYGAGNHQIVRHLAAIRQHTVKLIDDAEAAQHSKAEAAAALGEIAITQSVENIAVRSRLNALVQSASTSDSLLQLGELRRRYVTEITPGGAGTAPDARVSAVMLDPYERIFQAQSRYLQEMFAIRSAVARLHQVSRDLSNATETQTDVVTRRLNEDLVAMSNTLSRLLGIVVIASLLVLAMAIFSIRSVMRVSRGIVALSSGMNALAEGHTEVGLPDYRGSETEPVQLLEAFRAFKGSVDRVTRLRRTAEAAARTIRSTFRSINEGIALFDPAGQPITMNRRVIELVGRSGSARKLPLRKFVDQISEIDPSLLPGRGQPGLLSQTVVVRTRPSSSTVTEISLSRQPDGGVVLLARDVTQIDRQEAEAAKAQRLDGIMRMTHQVSHEVGNMIGIITGSLGLLEREAGFSDRQARHLARIRKAADRGRSLASSMLSIGSQQPIHPSATDVCALLRGMADILEIAIGPKCRLELELADNLPTVLLDPALFEQSVLNLCLNAAAAMPKGGKISLRCYNADGHLVVSVIDSGIGMSAAALDKAFEPYFTTRASEGGAGLGLAVVYGFVRQSGGEARIDSVPGTGTTISLYFPANLD
jgi:signal transduction histidine kinase